MNARDELAEVIARQHTIPGEGLVAITDALIAAGYRKPRIITTADELDAFGASTAVLAANGTVWVNDGDTEEPWACVTEDFHGGPVWANGDGIHLPATVLHEGEPTA